MSSSRHASKEPGSKVTIPIPPMLDMTFQLLVFFMLWFKPSALEGQMDLTLPTDKATSSAPTPPKDPTTPDNLDDIKEPPEVTVIIKAIREGDKRGEISALSVRLKEGETQITEDGASTKRLLELLVAKLEEIRPTLGNQTEVLMKGERQLKWQFVVMVRDACQKAKFTNAHFSPPPDL